jgi:7-keto-8-aminopelargonate synthetase-like enzyme
MGTLSKTLAGCGGYIAGCSELVEYLRLTAGVFVYSVGVAPVIAATTVKAIEILHREPERVIRLQQNGRYFLARAKEQGLDTGNGAGTAICPIVVGDSTLAVVLSHALLAREINVLPVAYPAVPARESRLRFFVTAMHNRRDIDTALTITAEELKKARTQTLALGRALLQG